MRRRGIGRQLRSRRKLILVWGTLLLIVVVYRLQQLCSKYFGKSCDQIFDDITLSFPWLALIMLVSGGVVLLIWISRERKGAKSNLNSGNSGFGRQPKSHRGSKHGKHAGALPADTERILKYWQACLIDAASLGNSGREIQGTGVEIPMADCLQGRVPPETVQLLVEKARESQNQVKQSKAVLEQFAEDRVGSIKILLCPLRFVWSSPSDPRYLGMPRFVDVLWIPATINERAELVPPRGRGPWIPRSLLEPISGDESLVIGELAVVEQFAQRYPFDEFPSWSAYWRQCSQFFQAVCGAQISEFSLSDYTKRKNACIIIDRSNQGARSPAYRIYDQVLRGNREVGLLKTIATLKDRKPIYLKHNVREMTKGALRHVGQFTDRFPLSRSQRRAIHQALNAKSGEILAVTGPPGTGKTTFIQCLIATLWVNAARYKNAAPPIIVVCAGTNQAVTNVISSFTESATTTNPLARRWLPDVRSYGCYCPAEARAESAKDVHIERTTGEGLSRSMETWDFVAKARQMYSSYCANYFGRQVAIADAVELFRRKIDRLLSELYRKTNQAAYGDLANWLLCLVGGGRRISTEEFEKALATFDQTVRYEAFLLATHYWEGRWLLAVDKTIGDRTAGVINTGFHCGRDDWHRRAMITPCFVATFATAPRFFGERLDQQVPLIDTLIVDEASQVLPEEGAASFSLAKRAIVVGDPQQLEPVCNIPEYVDVENLKRFSIVKKGSNEELKRIYKKGVTSARGSLMLLAQNACRIIDQNTIGIFLSEHRRSVPGVIAYVNALAYGSRLNPLRPQPERQLFPAFGYAHIPGVSRRVGPSWKNEDEAGAIANWLVKNREVIAAEYNGRPLESIVAVITPFAAQKRVLESLIHQHFPKMTVGTVHALQGAERDIVVFSPVYDQFHRGTYFFDQSIHMLNVGVSRAKDSFLVFGDMGIFRPRVESPSGLLARYLFHESAREICDISLPPRMGYAESEVRRLSTLEEHRQILQQSFSKAAQEILIVSPTISSRAIQSDGIPEMVRSACARGVSVLVYVDTFLNADGQTGELKPLAREGCAILRDAGAKVNVVKGIHNKTLAVDNHTIVEGSFNWFSAVRNINSAHQKYEVSICYTGAKVGIEIENTKELLRSLEEQNSSSS